jgi:hypothetical protein
VEIINEKWVAVGLLIFVGLILTLGKTLYKTMESIQKTIILVGIPFMMVLAFYLVGRSEWQEAMWGLVGKGDGWWFFPTGIAVASFLGAFAYSGAGGNLNLAQSYYVKERVLGWENMLPKSHRFFLKIITWSRLRAITLCPMLRITSSGKNGGGWSILSIFWFLVVGTGFNCCFGSYG